MKTLALATLMLMSQAGFAAELKDCETKIASMLTQVKTREVKWIMKSADGVKRPIDRLDTYHMARGLNCGVELVGGKGQLTVSKFKPQTQPSLEGTLELELKKFETIILNGNDPTYTNGRVQAQVNCSMDQDSVTYITKVPVLTDGVKTPFAIEKLTMKQENGILHVSLRAALTPIQSVYRSITDCELELE